MGLSYPRGWLGSSLDRVWPEVMEGEGAVVAPRRLVSVAGAELLVETLTKLTRDRRFREELEARPQGDSRSARGLHGELASLRELRKRHVDDPLVGLLIEAAVLHTEANLRVVELADEMRGPISLTAARSRSKPEEVEGRGRTEAARS